MFVLDVQNMIHAFCWICMMQTNIVKTDKLITYLDHICNLITGPNWLNTVLNVHSVMSESE